MGCQANVEMTPHKVLGFRTEEPVSKVGQPNLYSKNSAIGAWVLETQMYAHEPQFYQQESPPQVRQQQSQHQHIQQQQMQHQQIQKQQQLQQQQFQQQQQLQQQQQHQLLQQQQQYQQQLQQQQQQHLFNQQHKSQPQNQLLQKLQIQQQQQQYEHGQQQYGHNGVYGQYEVALAAPMGQVQQVAELEDPYAGYYPGQQGPVVLREPEPTYVDPGRMRQNKGKRPPPPPRRSQETQLTTNHVI